MKNPTAISCAHGRIQRILLAFPKYSNNKRHLKSLLADLGRKLPHYTKIEILVYNNEATKEAVESTLKSEMIDYFFYDDHHGDHEKLARLRDTQRCCIIKNPHYHNFSIWVQDPFLVVADEECGGSGLVLVEPHAKIAGTNDDEIANHFEELKIYRSKNAPLSFHGGNMLVADDFILVGAKHFNATKKLIAEQSEKLHRCDELDEMTRKHFANYLGKNMRIIPVGNGQFHDCILDYTQAWEETQEKEPFAHIDLYISLAGRNKNGQYQLVVGEPVATMPEDEAAVASLKELMNPVVEKLTLEGFKIIRNPMPLTRSRAGSNNEYYCFYNNALVEIDGNSKRIWMPTFGHWHWKKSLRKYDIENREIWHNLGFEVTDLMSFHPFVKQKAGVRCVTKYMGRFSVYDCQHH